MAYLSQCAPVCASTPFPMEGAVFDFEPITADERIHRLAFHDGGPFSVRFEGSASSSDSMLNGANSFDQVTLPPFLTRSPFQEQLDDFLFASTNLVEESVSFDYLDLSMDPFGLQGGVTCAGSSNREPFDFENPPYFAPLDERVEECVFQDAIFSFFPTTPMFPEGFAPYFDHYTPINSSEAMKTGEVSESRFSSSPSEQSEGISFSSEESLESTVQYFPRKKHSLKKGECPRKRRAEHAREYRRHKRERDQQRDEELDRLRTENRELRASISNLRDENIKWKQILSFQ